MRPFNSIGMDEAAAASTVINGSLPLSGYTASSQIGGWKVMALEQKWAETFRTGFAVACNSATSGLLAACMAAGIGPEDEVIVSAYTMSATAAAPKVLGAKIVWCDINPYTYTMDHVLIERLISKKTKAVIVTNLFGQAAHLRKIRSICDNCGLILIEDNAQAIFASEYDKLCGTVGHMGVFSLNVHKHLQVGEGGIIVTDDPSLDTKLRQAINHGEMRNGILGLNLRMTEVTAAMAMVQLGKARAIMKSRLEFAVELSNEVLRRSLPVSEPFARPECGHSYYCWAGLLKNGCDKQLPKPWRRGYQKPLYHLKAFGNGHLHLPVVEHIESRLVLVEICAYSPTVDEIALMVKQLGEVL